MNKKILLVFSIFISLLFSYTVCFADDSLTSTTDSMMENTEEKLEDTGNTIENSAQNMSEDLENKAENVTNDISTMTNSAQTDASNYTATQTSATGDATLMGLTSTSWTWLIIGIAAIVIIALVWYYSSQLTQYDRHDD